MNSALVTGGSGFIGSHLVDELSEEFDEIHVCDVSHNIVRGEATDAKRHTSDLTSQSDVESLLPECQPDCIFHLAAASNVNSEKDPTTQFRYNTEMTRNLISTATQLEKSPDVSFASSSVVYGHTDVSPTPETHEPTPGNYYGSGKVASEALLSTYAAQTSATVHKFRLANVVGPRLRDAVIPDFIGKLDNDPSELTILGNGQQRKSYIHVDDCVKAISGITSTCSESKVVNVGTDSAVSVDEIARIVANELDITPDYQYTGGEQGWTGDIPTMQLDITRLKELGFSPVLDCESAVKTATQQLISEIC